MAPHHAAARFLAVLGLTPFVSVLVLPPMILGNDKAPLLTFSTTAATTATNRSALVAEHLAAGLVLLTPATFLLHFYASTTLRGGRSAGAIGGGRLSYARAFFRAAAGLAGGWAALHALAVLFGAPLAALAWPTALWALLAATLSAMPSAVLLGTRTGAWARLYGGARAPRAAWRHLREWVVAPPAFGAVVGSWAGAWLVPLDWDRPWQTHPLPGVYGALVGHGVACAWAACACWRGDVGSANAKKVT